MICTGAPRAALGDTIDQRAVEIVRCEGNQSRTRQRAQRLQCIRHVSKSAVYNDHAVIGKPTPFRRRRRQKKRRVILGADEQPGIAEGIDG